MLKGQDILVLLWLLDAEPGWTVRSLAGELDLDPAGVHRALKRLEGCRIIDGGHRVNRLNAEEFLIHGLKYVFPVKQGGLVRGVPTAWAAPPLSEELAAVDEPPPVWPDAEGKTRGIALAPIHENAPRIAGRHPRLGERLALIDAVRMGAGRIRSLAARSLAASMESEALAR